MVPTLGARGPRQTPHNYNFRDANVTMVLVPADSGHERPQADDTMILVQADSGHEWPQADFPFSNFTSFRISILKVHNPNDIVRRVATNPRGEACPLKPRYRTITDEPDRTP